jgi:hypothetical protein
MLGEEQQREVMLEIRNQIIPLRGVRLRCEDIPGFPTCDIQAELYDIDNPSEVDQLYAEIHEALGLLTEKENQDVAPDSPITRLLRGRQRIELLKTPIATELANDYLEKGFSVVHFVNFRQTIDVLQAAFPAALVIDGSPDSLRNRDASIEKFQRNECQSLIVNCAAGSEALGLPDLDGLHPRVGLVMPNFSAQSMRQLFGRLPRDGGKSTAHYRVMFANTMIERGMHRAVRAKLNNMEALTDADLTGQCLILN